MFRKSLVIVVIMVSGILSCCTDVLPHWDINDFTITFGNGSGIFSDEGTFDSDSLIVQTALDIEFLSSVWGSNPFVNTALALSCEHDGHLGLKDKMTSINITSSQDYNTITAGNSLNNLFILNNPFFEFTDTNLDKLSEQLNQSYFFIPNLEFVIKEKPTNNATHQFTISMDFESGKNVVTTSKEITWN